MLEGPGFRPVFWALLISECFPPPLSYLVDEVANFIGVGRAWAVLRGWQEGGQNIIPEDDVWPGIEASVQLAEVVVLRGRQRDIRGGGREGPSSDHSIARKRHSCSSLFRHRPHTFSADRPPTQASGAAVKTPVPAHGHSPSRKHVGGGGISLS